jgi:hypothetical protein
MTLVGIIRLSDSSWVMPSAALGLAATGLAVLVWRRDRVRGTTLMACWYWALLALLSVAGVEAAIGFVGGTSPPDWAEPLRFAAATATFCPIMAALGAKRPQDRAWQFIVLSLWGVLALPAAEAYFIQPGQSLEVHDARAWFLLILIVVGAANSLLTRYWLSSLLLAAGQVALLAGYLPFVSRPLGTAGALGGLALGVAAVWLAAAGFPKRRKAEQPIDQLWLDFRDMFGVLWSLRVAERINAAAAMNGWNVALSWSGFRRADAAETDASAEIPADVAVVLRQNLLNLLRRFVSPQWIKRRLGELQ